MKNLIFITASFPFGNDETFIENEIGFLSEAFERIIIISTDAKAQSHRQVPGNVNVLRYDKSIGMADKLQSLKFLLTPEYRDEKDFVQKNYSIEFNKTVRNILLAALQAGRKFSDYLDRLLVDEQLDEKETLLYSYWLNEMAVGLAFLRKKHPRLKAISRAHGWDVYFERHNPPYLPLRNFMAKNLDGIYTVSEHGRSYIMGKVGEVGKEKIKLARLGTINNTAFEQKPKSKNKLRILSCSSIIPLKRLDLIVKALQNVEHINIEWTHIGAGNQGQQIKKLAGNSLAGKSNINYQFLGSLPNTEVISYYQNSKPDVFVNVSKFEGLPVSIMEAMSFGVPVIASDVGGVSEIVKDGAGFLIAPNKAAEELIVNLKALHNMDQQNYYLLSKGAYKMWDKYFNAEKNYRQFIKKLKVL